MIFGYEPAAVLCSKKAEEYNLLKLRQKKHVIIKMLFVRFDANCEIF